MLFLYTFLRGWSGAGLLLLRAAVGATAIVQGGLYLFGSANPRFGMCVIGLLAVACGAALLIGFLTPIAGVLVGLGGAGVALSWFPASAPNLSGDRPAIVFLIIMAAAIFLLGP